MSHELEPAHIGAPMTKEPVNYNLFKYGMTKDNRPLEREIVAGDIA